MQRSNGLFATPFSAAYWKCAAQEFRSLRVLVLTALFVALRIVVASLFIPVSADGSLRVYFSFFVNALGSLIYGPINGLMAGFASDIIGFFLHPTGAFFPGYVLTSMMGSFIYALFFYRARITWVRVALCKLSINLFVNLLMGSLWNMMLYNKGFYYYFAKSLFKNIVMLPLEVVVLVLFFRLMLPILGNSGLTPRQPSNKIPLI